MLRLQPVQGLQQHQVVEVPASLPVTPVWGILLLVSALFVFSQDRTQMKSLLVMARAA